MDDTTWYHKEFNWLRKSSKMPHSSRLVQVYDKYVQVIAYDDFSYFGFSIFQHGIDLNLTNTYVSGFNMFQHSDDTANNVFQPFVCCSWPLHKLWKMRLLDCHRNLQTEMPLNNVEMHKRWKHVATKGLQTCGNCTNMWKLCTKACTRPVLAGIVEMPVTQKVQLGEYFWHQKKTPGQDLQWCSRRHLDYERLM